MDGRGGPNDRVDLARWRPDPIDLEILGLLASGHTLEAVSRQVDMSERTVRRRMRTLADELGVDSTIEVVVVAARARLV